MRSAARVLERVLQLRRGDLGRGLLLFLHLFLAICAYVVGQVVRDSLFLDRFPASKLPFVDVGSVLLVGATAALYIRAGRRLDLRDLLVGSLLVFVGTGGVLWWLVRQELGAWLFPVVYVWVGVFGVFAPAQVWTLANYTLSPREAKRVFGLLASGATAGAVFGGFASSVIARRLGVEALLLVVVGCAAGAAATVEAVWRRRLSPLRKDEGERSTAAGGGPRSLGESMRLVLAAPELRALAGLIVVSSFATSVIGWQFKAIAQQALVHKEALAPFFGTLNGVVGALSFLTQVLVTPLILRRLELGTVLLALPLTLVVGSSALLAWGGLAVAIALRMGDKVLRYSIDRPAVELLYLPLPPSVKMPVKSFIDTVVWRLGDGLAGLAVLAFATVGGASAAGMSWVTLAVLAVWLVLAVLSRGRYVGMLREAIRQHRLEAERASAPVLDRSLTDMLTDRFDAADPREILYALELFTVAPRPPRHPAIRGLLGHDSPQVRERALRVLSESGDRAALPEAEHLLGDPHVGVRTEALLYLALHSDVDPVTRVSELGAFPEFSVRAAVVAVLARSGSEHLEVARQLLHSMAAEPGPEGARTRLEAARLGATMPDTLGDPLAQLILDSNVEVARAAIAAAAQLDPRRFREALLSRLGDPKLSSAAASALAAAGEDVLPALRAALADQGCPLPVRREIPAVLAGVGTAEAAEALAAHLLEPDILLRTRVVSGLNRLRRDHPEWPIDVPLVETALAAEIMGHYRSWQILGHLDRGGDSSATRGLRDAMDQEIERIFRLLSLLFPGHDFHSAHVGLRSGGPVVHGQALDFLENILKPSMRRLLIPLVDPEVSPEQRVRLADSILGSAVEGPEQAVAALAGSHDPWLRSCAAYAIGALGLREMESALDEWAADPDPLLRETVRQARRRLAEGVPGSGGSAQ